MRLRNFFKDLYKDDPEGYEHHLKQLEASRIQRAKQEVANRQNVASLLSLPLHTDVEFFISQLSIDESTFFSTQFSRIKRDIKFRYSQGAEDVEIPFQSSELSFSDRKKVSDMLLLPTEGELDAFLDKMTPSQQVFHYSLLHQVHELVLAQYNQLMDEKVFAVSTTTFRDVILRTTWKEVHASLLATYSDHKGPLKHYERVFNELLELNTVANEEHHVIILSPEHSSVTYKDGTKVESVSYDVSGIKPCDMSHYAIEYCRWEEWLGYYCNQSDLDFHGDAVFVAHCMWEMTFTGYSQATVQSKFDDLVQRVDDLKDELDEHLDNEQE